MGTSQSSQCGTCERTVINVFGDDNFLRCYRCNGVYCSECAGISTAQYERVRYTNWYCAMCSQYS